MKKQKQTELVQPQNSYLRKNGLDIVSLIIAFVSLIITIYIGYKTNEIALRSQPLDYSVNANEYIEVTMNNGDIYTLEPIEFHQEKGVWSGDLSSVFLGTVVDDSVDIVYVPDKLDEEIGFAHVVEEKIMYHIPYDNPNQLFFGPVGTDIKELGNELQAFHFIFKGFNKEYTIYSVVFTFGELIGEKKYTVKETGENFSWFNGFLNIYVLNEDNIYDISILQQIADDLNKLNENYEQPTQFTSNSVLETIVNERNLCYQEINEAS